MNLEEENVSYIEAIRDVHNSINQLQGEKYIKNHKKTLYFSIIETLSKSVYGDNLQNHDRFKRFIKEIYKRDLWMGGIK